MTNDKVTLEIEVKDDGSIVIKNFRSAVEDSLSSCRTASEKSEKSAKSLWSEFVKGQAVYDGLKWGAKQFVDVIKDSIGEYMKAEDVNVRLVGTLRQHGFAIEANIKRYDEFANQMQKVTIHDDETIKSLVNMAYQFGIADENIEAAVKGAIGLSDAYGIDMQTALKGTAAAMQGNFRTLSLTLPQLLSASTETEKFAKFQKILADAIGQSENKAKTLTGQWTQMGNQIDDVKESIGNAIVQTLLPYLQKAVEWFKENRDKFEEWIRKGGEYFASLAKVVTDIISKLYEYREILLIIGGAVAVAFTVAKVIDFTNAIKKLIILLAANPFGVILTGLSAAFAVCFGKILADLNRTKEEYNKMQEWAAGRAKESEEDFKNYIKWKESSADATRAFAESEKYATEQMRYSLHDRIKDIRGYNDEFRRFQMGYIGAIPAFNEWRKSMGLLADPLKKNKDLLTGFNENLDSNNLKMQAQAEVTKKTAAELKNYFDILNAMPKGKTIDMSTGLITKAPAIDDLYEIKAAMEGASESTKLFNFSLKSVEESYANVTIGWQDAINVGGVLLNTLDDLRSMMVELGIVTEEDAGKFDDAFSLMDNELKGASAALSGDFAGALESTLNRYMTIFKVTWALFHQGQDQAIERENSWMKITDEQMERMKELATQYGSTHAATSVMLSDLIETNSITVRNFDRYAGRMHEILSDMDQGKLTNEETVQAIGSAWSALMDKMKDLKLPGASKEMIATIQDLRARGMEVAEISEYVDAELGKGIKALGVYFKEASKSSEQFARGQQYMAAMFAETVRTKGYMAAIEEYGSVFDQLAAIAKEKGFAISATLQEAFDMRALLQGNESIAALYEQINATQQILESLGNTGLLTMETFSAAMLDVNAQYAQLIEHGATEKQALQMTGPELAKLWWYSKQYGYALDESTASLIKQGMESGAINAQMIPAQDKMVSLMETMVTLLGGDIPYAMEKTADSAKTLLDGTMSKTKDLNGMMDETFRERSFDSAGIKDSFGEIANAARSLGSEIDGAFRSRSFSASFSAGGEVHAATGWEGIVAKPTRFLAGELEPEYIKITPMSGAGRQYGDGVTNQRLEKLELNFTIQTQGGQDVAQEIVKAIELDKYNIRKKAKDAWKFAVSSQ